MKVVHEFFCPGCGDVVDAPSDEELQEADKVVTRESSEKCFSCRETGAENREVIL